MLITAVATVILAAGLWIGLPGIISGARVIAKRGPDHLMHYPVGVPWFRGKVNTARWVVNMGRVFAGGALLITTTILSIAWWPADDGTDLSACERLAPLAPMRDIAGGAVDYIAQVQNEHRCELVVQTQDTGKTFLKIEVDAPKALIGANLESQRRELERRAMKLRPMPVLGSDAVLAFRPGEPNKGAVFLFTDGGATVRVKTASAIPDQLKTLARIFARQRTAEG